MKRNEFLTEIAKEYSPKIQTVFFCRLDDGKQGVVFRWKDDDSLCIDIDRDKLICPHQVLYVLYHEIGHIILGHCDRTCTLAEAVKERQADMWAFKEMGTIDPQGRVKEDLKVCHECMRKLSKTCLRGFGGKTEKVPGKKR